jgi:hypothetical protein
MLACPFALANVVSNFYEVTISLFWSLVNFGDWLTLVIG